MDDELEELGKGLGRSKVEEGKSGDKSGGKERKGEVVKETLGGRVSGLLVISLTLKYIFSTRANIAASRLGKRR